METDSAAGKRTLVVRFGRRFARGQFIGSLVIALVAVPALLALRDHNAWRLLPLALTPMALRHIGRLRHQTQPEQQILLLGDTGKLLALYALLLTVGLVVNCG